MSVSSTWRQCLLALAALVALAACQSGAGSGGSTPATTTTLDPLSTTIISTNSTAATADCPDGGVHVDWGIDKNQNGLLDTDEITGSGDVCNGDVGSSAKIISAPFAPPSADATASGCASQRGLKLTIWLDLNENGLADDANTTVAYVCDGQAGFNALVVTSIEPPGDNCAFGGLSIRSGQDTTGDGSLVDEPGATTNYVCNTGGMALIQVPDWQTAAYFRSVPEVGLSTWDRIDGIDVGTGAWLTVGEPTYFYDSHVLTNRSGATEDVDVVVLWGFGPQSGRINVAKSWQPPGVAGAAKNVGATEVTIGGSNGTTSLYDYPFNPLLPLINVQDWSNDYEGIGGIINLLSFSLDPGASVVIVPSPQDANFALDYVLQITSSQVVDASGVGPGTPLALNGTAVVAKPRRYKLTGLASNGEYQAIVTSFNGDDAKAFSYARPIYPQGFSICENPSNMGTGNYVNACGLTADSAGTAWLEVLGVILADTGAYDLDVREAPASEGSQTPVPLTLGAAASGSVGPFTTSYYAVGSVLGDSPYRITLSDLYPTGAVELVLNDSGGTTTCTGDTTTTELACDLRTDIGSSSMTVDVYENGFYTGGAEYTITVGPATEGTAVSPQSLTPSSPRNSAVDVTASYYRVTGVGAQGDDWNAVLSNIAFVGSGQLSVTVTSNGAPPATNTCVISSPGTSPPCTITAPLDATMIDITVDGSGTTAGATYTIDVSSVAVP